MATAAEVLRLRRMIDEPSTDTYSDSDLSTFLDASENIDLAAADLWLEKAASLARLVNVSESGSSRSLSDLHKNALLMASNFSSSGRTEIAEEEETASSRTRVNSIVRS
jgi:hypothetical protein